MDLVTAINFPDAIQLPSAESIGSSHLNNIISNSADSCFFICASVPEKGHAEFIINCKRIILYMQLRAPGRVVFVNDGPRPSPTLGSKLSDLAKQEPFVLCARHWVRMARPTWWWTNVNPTWPPCTSLKPFLGDALEVIPPEVHQKANFIQKGWREVDPSRMFSSVSLRQRCDQVLHLEKGAYGDSEATRLWTEAGCDQAIHNYLDYNLVEAERSKIAGRRRLIAPECEKAHGLPENFTASVISKSLEPAEVERRRQNVVARSWVKFAATFVMEGIFFGNGIEIGKSENQNEEADESEVDFSPAHLLSRSNFLTAAITETVWHAYHKMVYEHESILKDMFEACPFNQWLNGGKSDLWRGPDAMELHAAKAAAIAGGIQTKSMSNAVRLDRLVPKGLPPKV